VGGVFFGGGGFEGVCGGGEFFFIFTPGGGFSALVGWVLSPFFLVEVARSFLFEGGVSCLGGGLFGLRGRVSSLVGGLPFEGWGGPFVGGFLCWGAVLRASVLFFVRWGGFFFFFFLRGVWVFPCWGGGPLARGRFLLEGDLWRGGFFCLEGGFFLLFSRGGFFSGGDFPGLGKGVFFLFLVGGVDSGVRGFFLEGGGVIFFFFGGGRVFFFFLGGHFLGGGLFFFFFFFLGCFFFLSVGGFFLLGVFFSFFFFGFFFCGVFFNSFFFFFFFFSFVFLRNTSLFSLLESFLPFSVSASHSVT